MKIARPAFVWGLLWLWILAALGDYAWHFGLSFWAAKGERVGALLDRLSRFLGG